MISKQLKLETKYRSKTARRAKDKLDDKQEQIQKINHWID